MKRARLVRLFSALGIATLWLLLIASPALAIGSPDSLQINSVYVYRHCLETNDQLYLVEYFVDYDPDNPDENITEAYLGRLMDGTDELGAVAWQQGALLREGKLVPIWKVWSRPYEQKA